MDRSLADDLRETLASAHELVRDLLEEGVELFERTATPLGASPQGTTHASGAAGGGVARSAQGAEGASQRAEGERGSSSWKASEAHQARGRASNPDRSGRLDAGPIDVASQQLQPSHAVPSSTQSSLLSTPSPFGPTPTLESVRATLGDCTRCRLAAGRTQIVFGDGNPDADIVFVGEGPGEQEDLQGVPFVGRAGELLTQMIERGLSIPRRSVYICNIVKCRPPQNRTPLADEVAACRAFLDGQIDAVRPKVIVALGKPATSLLLGREVSITRVRGIFHEYRGHPLMPTFHPAFVLRQYTPENRRLVWEDLKAALARARELGGRFDA
jgi:uracil-DNA glycosylase